MNYRILHHGLLLLAVVLAIFGLVSCDNDSGSDSAPAPNPQVEVYYTASSSSNDGSFFVDYEIRNTGNVDLTMTNARFAIYGTAGGQLTDVVKTYDDLAYVTITAGTSSETYTLEGYSEEFIPASFAFDFDFSTSGGAAFECVGTGDFTISSASAHDLSAKGDNAAAPSRQAEVTDSIEDPYPLVE